jgi:hypothetical protein
MPKPVDVKYCGSRTICGVRFKREGREYVIVSRLPQNMVLAVQTLVPEPSPVLMMHLPEPDEINAETPVNSRELEPRED